MSTNRKMSESVKDDKDVYRGSLGTANSDRQDGQKPSPERPTMSHQDRPEKRPSEDTKRIGHGVEAESDDDDRSRFSFTADQERQKMKARNDLIRRESLRIQQIMNLKHEYVYHKYKVDTRTAEKLFHTFQYQAITNIDFTETKMKDLDINDVILPKTLQRLIFKRCYIENFKLDRLAYLEQLREINFSFNNCSQFHITDQTFPSQLQDLCMRCVKIDCEKEFDTEALFVAIRNLQDLVRLDLSQNNLVSHANEFLFYMPSRLEECVLEHTRLKMDLNADWDRIGKEFIRLVNITLLTFPPPKKAAKERLHAALNEADCQHNYDNVKCQK